MTAPVVIFSNSSKPRYVVSSGNSANVAAARTTVTLYLNTSSEETIPYGSETSILNHLPYPITLRNGEGLKVDQTTSSNAGFTNIVAIFTIK